MYTTCIYEGARERVVYSVIVGWSSLSDNVGTGVGTFVIFQPWKNFYINDIRDIPADSWL